MDLENSLRLEKRRVYAKNLQITMQRSSWSQRTRWGPPGPADRPKAHRRHRDLQDAYRRESAACSLADSLLS